MDVPSPRWSVESAPRVTTIRRIVTLEPAPLAELMSPVDPGAGWARTVDLVFHDLVGAIRTLRLLPGSLLVEAEIAAAAHVGRNPVREAIARLTDAGLVTLFPHVGTTVARIRWREVEQALRVREGLETDAFAAACAAPMRDVTRMRDSIEVQRRAAEARDIRAFVAASELFHEELLAVADVVGGRTVPRTPHFHLDRVRRLTPPDQDTLSTIIDEHTVIADAVESGEAMIGQQTLLRHLRRLSRFPAEAYAAHPEYFTE